MVGILSTFGWCYLPLFSCLFSLRSAENLVYAVLLFLYPTLLSRIIHFDEIVVFSNLVLAQRQFTGMSLSSGLFLFQYFLVLLLLMVQPGSRVGGLLWHVLGLYITCTFQYTWEYCICIYRYSFARSQIESNILLPIGYNAAHHPTEIKVGQVVLKFRARYLWRWSLIVGRIVSRWIWALTTQLSLLLTIISVDLLLSL